MTKPKWRGTYYDPPTEIRGVPGVTKRRGRWAYEDIFVGAKEDLIAAGLLQPGMFPGDLGRGLSRTTHFPKGVLAGSTSGCAAPGYMTVHRAVTGLFRVALTVSLEEQARRRPVQEQQRSDSEAPTRALSQESIAGYLAECAWKGQRRLRLVSPT